MNKKIKINMILNALKGIISLAFPLISFPYISRILGIEQLGQYNFANSFCTYFILLAGLGISTYAIRECSKVKDNKEEFE